MTPRFRVWNGSEMYYPPHAYLLTGDGKVVEHTDPIDTQHEVMLSTGLTDAESTEIWEGDILGRLGAVRYNTDLGGFELVRGGALVGAGGRVDEKVIGNVHEHEHDAALD